MLAKKLKAVLKMVSTSWKRVWKKEAMSSKMDLKKSLMAPVNDAIFNF